MSRKKKSSIEPFLILPKRTLLSEELNAISVHARWLYVILCTEWKRNGSNSPFMFTYSRLSVITGFDRRRISSCIKELISGGFLTVESSGGLLRNPSIYLMNEEMLYLNNIGTHGNNN